MVEHPSVYHERRGGKFILRTIFSGGKLDFQTGTPALGRDERHLRSSLPDLGKSHSQLRIISSRTSIHTNLHMI
jgi:hypothetical protein